MEASLSYRTILVHLDESPACSARVELACSLARAQPGHLVGLVPSGYTRLAGEAATSAATARYPQVPAREAAQRAGALAADFERSAAAHRVASFEARVHDADPTSAVLAVGPGADLVIVGQTDPEAWNPFAPAVAQVLMELGRPVLVVPCHGRHAAVGRNVLVAWDGSAQSTRALGLALPLLVRATSVHVAVLQGVADEAPVAADAMRDLGRNLERHGVAATLERVVASDDVAPALRLRAADEGADLIVMGAYGHSRLREWILGGATREMLERMTVPVLLSH